ncbi:hypothetical protein ACQ4PT_007552 [Festuca glaucescens]
MDVSASGREKCKEALSPMSARAKLEEEMGKLDITEEEATPLVVDDREEAEQHKWVVAGKQDRDHVWVGPPWHVSKNVVILSEFGGCMKPSELKFDRLSLWARIINLPFNLREKKWWLPIAKQIDKGTKEVHFDHIGGYLRARVPVDVSCPLRRWILIDSAK